MLGYIISDKDEINVKEYEIQPFNILHNTDLNIFVVENNKVLYKNNIINYAFYYGHIQVLEWFINSGYNFKYSKNPITSASYNGKIQVLEWFKNSGYKFKYNIKVFKTKIIKILKFYCHNVNIKKIIKWSSNIFIKTIKFKIINKYLKGYQKN
jgi:hypothetical protein